MLLLDKDSNLLLLRATLGSHAVVGRLKLLVLYRALAEDGTDSDIIAWIFGGVLRWVGSVAVTLTAVTVLLQRLVGDRGRELTTIRKGIKWN